MFNEQVNNDEAWITCLQNGVVLPCADPENFLRGGGGGGPNSQKGSDRKFQHGKKLIIWQFQGGGGPDPLSPPSGSAHAFHSIWTLFPELSYLNLFQPEKEMIVFLWWFCVQTMPHVVHLK